MDPKVNAERPLGQGKWLTLSAIDYTDAAGQPRVWESVQRVGNVSAVMVIVRLEPSGDTLFVEQFRPPAKAYAIEFPAGLVDVGETPAETALRELEEETGYHGAVTGISPIGYSSAGLAGETVVQVQVTVDETLVVNQHPRTRLGEDEHIAVHRVPMAQAGEFLKAKLAAGRVLDSKVITVFLDQLKVENVTPLSH
jgi:ADP-ribose pyrophosphatase